MSEYLKKKRIVNLVSKYFKIKKGMIIYFKRGSKTAQFIKEGDTILDKFLIEEVYVSSRGEILIKTREIGEATIKNENIKKIIMLDPIPAKVEKWLKGLNIVEIDERTGNSDFITKLKEMERRM